MVIEARCICGIPLRYEHECLRNDVPVPEHLVAAKEQTKRGRKESAWPGFFEKWQVGESVVVGWTALSSMQQYAKWMGQKIFWVRVSETMGGMASARVWRIG